MSKDSLVYALEQNHEEQPTYTCGDCRFWSALNSKEGSCKYDPIKLFVLKNEVYSGWPAPYKAEPACGKFVKTWREND